MKNLLILSLLILFTSFGCRGLNKAQNEAASPPVPPPVDESFGVANQPPVVSIFMNGQRVDPDTGLPLPIGKTVDGFEVRVVDPDGDRIQQKVTVLSSDPQMDWETIQLGFHPLVGRCDQPNQCTFGFTPADIISPGEYTITIGVSEEAAPSAVDPETGTATFKAVFLPVIHHPLDVLNP